MSERLKDAALGFDSNAVAYERARPSYPAEAVAHVVEHGAIGPGRRVIDLAAGTGKLTRLLVPMGADVVAVEPVAGMRAQLAAGLPGIEVLDGTAEDLPLPDDSADAVTVAQAFHWFDAPVALAEIRRVLHPGGHLFLLWNTRDRGHDWVRAFGDLLVDGPDAERPYDSYYDVDYAALVASAGGFTPVELWAHAWEQPCDPDLLVARAESVSVVGALADAERARVLDRVRELARTHPDLAGRASFGFPYVTRVYRCRTTEANPA
ncbi:MAG TPA: methyltransferase domain-containing protein [Acidimicrobiales bacterium]|nr:methyltransferase domain-containing protein [Acidimicrobiales bacterium]